MRHPDDIVIAVPRYFLHVCGSPTEAVYLSQVVYYLREDMTLDKQSPYKRDVLYQDDDGVWWVARADGDWEHELGMDRSVIWRSRTKLIKDELLVLRPAAYTREVPMVRPNTELLRIARDTPLRENAEEPLRENAQATPRKRASDGAKSRKTPIYKNSNIKNRASEVEEPTGDATVSTLPLPPFGGATKETNSPTKMIDMPTEARRLCDLFASLLNDRPGHRRVKVTQRWVDTMDRLIRIDGRSARQVEIVIRWLDQAPDDVAAWWRPNVQGPQKLREQWDIMSEQYKRAKSGRPVARSTEDPGSTKNIAAIRASFEAQQQSHLTPTVKELP